MKKFAASAVAVLGLLAVAGCSQKSDLTYYHLDLTPLQSPRPAQYVNFTRDDFRGFPLVAGLVSTKQHFETTRRLRESEVPEAHREIQDLRDRLRNGAWPKNWYEAVNITYDELSYEVRFGQYVQ